MDFLHAFRSASRRMLEQSEEKKIFGGRLTIRVLRPEDLVGLKVQAMVNDKSRWTNDLADIEGIMALHTADLDWSIIEEYFALFGLEDSRPGYEVIGQGTYGVRWRGSIGRP
ncbi:MAG: nucleotidyltransferase [Thermodesulfobacteriota bacterium]